MKNTIPRCKIFPTKNVAKKGGISSKIYYYSYRDIDLGIKLQYLVTKYFCGNKIP